MNAWGGKVACVSTRGVSPSYPLRDAVFGGNCETRTTARWRHVGLAQFCGGTFL